MPFYVWSCEKEHDLAVEKTFEHKMEPKAPECPQCGALMERDYHLESRRHIPASGFPYKTRNLAPDGREIEVLDSHHEAELCKMYGKVKRDDAAFLDKQYLGYNWKTKKQEYSEGSGRGLPGCWV